MSLLNLFKQEQNESEQLQVFNNTLQFSNTFVQVSSIAELYVTQKKITLIEAVKKALIYLMLGFIFGSFLLRPSNALPIALLSYTIGVLYIFFQEPTIRLIIALNSGKEYIFIFRNISFETCVKEVHELSKLFNNKNIQKTIHFHGTIGSVSTGNSSTHIQTNEYKEK